MERVHKIVEHIDKSKEGLYFEIPFQVDDDVSRIDIRYSYPKNACDEVDGVVTCKQINIVDLSLSGPNGAYLGSSGSDRDHIWVSGYTASEGYTRTSIKAGQWAIIVGAYMIADEGVDVTYTITTTLKEQKLYKGETHMHTLSSDGFMSPEDTAHLARSMGLDYIILTDHNNFAQNEKIIEIDGLTIIPGMEWTHYKGHAGMFGLKKPIDGPFYTNSMEGTAEKLKEARENGAFVTLNHPFCPYIPWQWGFHMDFDAVEVWNGIMSARNVKAINWWHQQLLEGKRIVITGGSDFHRLHMLSSIGSPCMCLYALSRDPEDLLDAMRAGHSYISDTPDGPGVEVLCEAGGLGDEVPMGSKLQIRFFELMGCDIIKLITDKGEEIIPCPANIKEMTLKRCYEEARFCRFEVFRSYDEGLPMMYAMVSNPVYFE